MARKKKSKQQEAPPPAVNPVDVAPTIAGINTQFGRTILTTLDGANQNVVSVSGFSFSAPRLNYVLTGTSHVGMPRGKIIEIFGQESSGKTTLCLTGIASAQRAGGTAAFVDMEHAVDIDYGRKLGVDTKKLLFAQPDNGEEALELVLHLVERRIDVIVVDSVAALVPRAEIEGTTGDAFMGLHARLMSQALRKLCVRVGRAEVTVIFINQIRHKIGVIFGSPEVTTGGNALKFYAALRLRLTMQRSQGKKIKGAGMSLVDGDDDMGAQLLIRVVKNKVAPPFRTVELPFLHGRGIDYAWDAYQFAQQLGLIQRLPKNSKKDFIGGYRVGDQTVPMDQLDEYYSDVMDLLRGVNFHQLREDGFNLGSSVVPDTADPED